MLFDLHVHTSHGSGDSTLSLQELVEEAYAIGLDGACLTEHDTPWDPDELQRIAGQYNNILLVPALEMQTNMGHVIVIGLDRDASEITRATGIMGATDLRRVSDEVGAYMIAAHPFRYLLDRSTFHASHLLEDPLRYPGSVEEAMRHPLFNLVDAIEVANGGNTSEENAFAWEVAHRLKKPMVGGSDGHSGDELGRCVTVFPGPIDSKDQFLETLRTGKYYPAVGLREGGLRSFREGTE